MVEERSYVFHHLVTNWYPSIKMLMEDSWFVLKSKIANWFNTVHFVANFCSIIAKMFSSLDLLSQSKVVYHWSSFVNVCLLCKLVFCWRLSSVVGCFPSNFVFQWWLSSIKCQFPTSKEIRKKIWVEKSQIFNAIAWKRH